MASVVAERITKLLKDQRALSLRRATSTGAGSPLPAVFDDRGRRSRDRRDHRHGAEAGPQRDTRGHRGGRGGAIRNGGPGRRRSATAILRRWFELIMASQDDLARLMTLEQGKPLAESRDGSRLRRVVHRMVRRRGASARTATPSRRTRATSASSSSRSRSGSSAASRRGTSPSR